MSAIWSYNLNLGDVVVGVQRMIGRSLFRTEFDGKRWVPQREIQRVEPKFDVRSDSSLYSVNGLSRRLEIDRKTVGRLDACGSLGVVRVGHLFIVSSESELDYYQTLVGSGGLWDQQSRRNFVTSYAIPTTKVTNVCGGSLTKS